MALDVIVTHGAGKALGEPARRSITWAVFPGPCFWPRSPDPGRNCPSRAAKELGYPDRPTSATDMVFMDAGVVLGGLVGILSIVVVGAPLAANGGAPVMGLVFVWPRSVNPVFGRIPHPAMWIFDTRGSIAAPSMLSGLKRTAFCLLGTGLLCALLLQVIGYCSLSPWSRPEHRARTRRAEKSPLRVWDAVRDH
jgi:hypothetical protein